MENDEQDYPEPLEKKNVQGENRLKVISLSKFLTPDSSRLIKEVKQSSSRGRSVLVLLILIFAVCLGQLFLIQIVQGPELALEAVKSRTQHDIIPAKRGDILDRNGKVLATSIEVYDLAVNQKQVKNYVDERVYDRNGIPITNKNKQELGDPRNKTVIEGYGAEAAAKRLAPYLKVSAAQLGGLMVGNRGFVYLVKGITPETYRNIMKLRINGITGERRFMRAYPNGSLASSILGFVDYQDQGLAGIELTQNKILTGTPGKKEVEISATGQVIPGGFDVSKEAKTGRSVKLTIDRDIQAVAETSLNRQLKKSGSEWGAVVVQNVHTGEILAMADTENKPPYENRNSKDSFKGSRAVQYSFEPGSTGKTITMVAALTQKKVQPTSLVKSPYSIVKNNERIHDAVRHPVWDLSAAGVLVRSSNTGTVQIGSRLSDQYRYEMMRRLGIGQKTGIELPGETPGRLLPPEKWDRRSRLVNMFGQSYSMNAIQLTSLFATYGADGIYYAPRIIMGMQNKQGEFEAQKFPSPKKVLDPNVAATLVKMMRGVIAPNGYGAEGQMSAYWSAGKTGTAEIIGKTGRLEGTVATYGAVAPADKPKIAVGVIFYKPTKLRYGGPVCGPVYKEVAEFTLNQMGIPPNSGAEEIYPTLLD